jgi:hypothetical protein
MLTNWQTHMRVLAETAAHDLEGTPKSLHELGVTIVAAQDDKTFCARLDELVFECAVCGWWCSMDEANDTDGGEYACTDCSDV